MAEKLRFLPFTLAVSGALTVLAVIVGYLLRQGPGALGAGAGVVLAVFLFVMSTVFITWVDTVNRAMMLGAVLLAYFLKLCLLFAVLNAVATQNWAGLNPMAFGVAAGVIGWIGAYAWWLWHAKIPYVEL